MVSPTGRYVFEPAGDIHTLVNAEHEEMVTPSTGARWTGAVLAQQDHRRLESFL